MTNSERIIQVESPPRNSQTKVHTFQKFIMKMEKSSVNTTTVNRFSYEKNKWRKEQQITSTKMSDVSIKTSLDILSVLYNNTKGDVSYRYKRINDQEIGIEVWSTNPRDIMTLKLCWNIATS